MRVWDLQDVFHFFRIGGDGDRDVDREGERILCRLSFSFCLRRPLLGAGTSLSVFMAAFALSLSLSDYYCGSS